MPEYVRVFDSELNRKYSVIGSALVPEVQTVIDEPATDVAGDPLPPEFDCGPQSSLSNEQTGRTSGKVKENDNG